MSSSIPLPLLHSNLLQDLQVLAERLFLHIQQVRVANRELLKFLLNPSNPCLKHTKILLDHLLKVVMTALVLKAQQVSFLAQELILLQDQDQNQTAQSSLTRGTEQERA